MPNGSWKEGEKIEGTLLPNNTSVLVFIFHILQEFQSKLLHQISFPNELFARDSFFNISVHIMPQCCVCTLFISWKYLPDLTPMQLTIEISQGHTAAEQLESV